MLEKISNFVSQPQFKVGDNIILHSRRFKQREATIQKLNADNKTANVKTADGEDYKVDLNEMKEEPSIPSVHIQSIEQGDEYRPVGNGTGKERDAFMAATKALKTIEKKLGRMRVPIIAVKYESTDIDKWNNGVNALWFGNVNFCVDFLDINGVKHSATVQVPIQSGIVQDPEYMFDNMNRKFAMDSDGMKDFLNGINWIENSDIKGNEEAIWNIPGQNPDFASSDFINQMKKQSNLDSKAIDILYKNEKNASIKKSASDKFQELEEIANRIKQGNTSGIDPYYDLEIILGSEPDENDYEHIADYVKDGYQEGEIIRTNPETHAPESGYWKIKTEANLNKKANIINLAELPETEIADLIYDTIMKNVGMSEYHIEFDVDKVEDQEISGNVIKFTYDGEPFTITVTKEMVQQSRLNKKAEDTQFYQTESDFTITEEELRKLWANEQPIEIEGNKYGVHKMSYGDYFLEPYGGELGETQGFAKGTLWLEKRDGENNIYGIESKANLSKLALYKRFSQSPWSKIKRIVKDEDDQEKMRELLSLREIIDSEIMRQQEENEANGLDRNYKVNLKYRKSLDDMYFDILEKYRGGIQDYFSNPKESKKIVDKVLRSIKIKKNEKN